MLNLTSSLRCQVQKWENTGADIEHLVKRCKQIQISRQKRWGCHGRAENCGTLIFNYVSMWLSLSCAVVGSVPVELEPCTNEPKVEKQAGQDVGHESSG